MHFPLTSQQISLSKRFLGYKFLSYLFFIHAIWFHFYRLFINDQQIGLLDSIAFTIGLCAEVPSGVLADLYGRGRIVKLGQIPAAVGFIIQGFGDSFLKLLIGQSIFMIGSSLISGADDAFFFRKT